MTTPYRYRFRLGKNNPRRIDGNRIVWLHGSERFVTQNEVEFLSERKLTFREFQLAVNGTIGIEQVFGDFVEEYREELIKFDMYTSLITKEHAIIRVESYLKAQRENE